LILGRWEELGYKVTERFLREEDSEDKEME
jgi:hypothetical protein